MSFPTPPPLSSIVLSSSDLLIIFSAMFGFLFLFCVYIYYRFLVCGYHKVLHSNLHITFLVWVSNWDKIRHFPNGDTCLKRLEVKITYSQ